MYYITFAADVQSIRIVNKLLMSKSEQYVVAHFHLNSLNESIDYHKVHKSLTTNVSEY